MLNAICLFQLLRGAWTSRVDDLDQWIQAELSDGFNVTAIQTQGKNDNSVNGGQWVMTYKLSFSNDGLKWDVYTKDDGSEMVRNLFFRKYFNQFTFEIYIYKVLQVNETILCFYLQIFQANTDRFSIVTNILEPPLKHAKFVRILPQSWHTDISLRFEILGCSTGKNATINIIK